MICNMSAMMTECSISQSQQMFPIFCASFPRIMIMVFIASSHNWHGHALDNWIWISYDMMCQKCFRLASILMVSYIGISVGIKQSYWHPSRDICHSDLDWQQTAWCKEEIWSNLSTREHLQETRQNISLTFNWLPRSSKCHLILKHFWSSSNNNGWPEVFVDLAAYVGH